MINLALFNESFNPQFDGVAVTVENYAKIFHRRHESVCVIVPAFPGRDFGSFPFPVWEYPSSPITVGDQYRIGLTAPQRLIKKFNEMDIDLVHFALPVHIRIIGTKACNQKRGSAYFNFSLKV